MTHRPGGREMGGYLLLSYGTAWGIWLMCGMMPPGAVTAQLLNTVVMWTPALAVWLMWLAGRRRPVLSFSLRPALRRNWKWYLAAWALSLAAAVLGALLYFGVYPRDFDSTLPALAPMMEQAGISRSTVVSLLLGVLVYGPVINLFFAIGEEIGWRGFLYPALRQRSLPSLPACWWARFGVCGTHRSILWDTTMAPAIPASHGWGFWGCASLPPRQALSWPGCRRGAVPSGRRRWPTGRSTPPHRSLCCSGGRKGQCARSGVLPSPAYWRGCPCWSCRLSFWCGREAGGKAGKIVKARGGTDVPPRALV